MRNFIKKVLRPFVPKSVFKLRAKRYNQKQLETWQSSGRPVPPPHIVKQMAIADYQQKYGYTTLIETGTFYGDMVEAQKKRFKKVISIELGVDLFKRAQKKFHNDKNVVIVNGDSSKALIPIVEDLKEPAIFWLDGHYSSGDTARGNKDCPVFEELDAIFAGRKFNHVLLIDDARCFIGENDYPTIDKLTEYIKDRNDSYLLEVKDDIIRYTI
jgi:hypothetical protein